MLKRNGLLGLALILAVFAIGVGLSTLNVNAQTAEDCNNGVDDDDDKDVDCDDTDCAEAENCKDPEPPTGCQGLELPIPGNANKATLCHFTGSTSNPFIINEVGASAVDSHADHHGDCWRFADGTTVCIP